MFFAFIEKKKGYRWWQVRQEVQRIQVLMGCSFSRRHFLLVHSYVITPRPLKRKLPP